MTNAAGHSYAMERRKYSGLIFESMCAAVHKSGFSLIKIGSRPAWTARTSFRRRYPIRLKRRPWNARPMSTEIC
jgi:hypothetical protein